MKSFRIHQIILDKRTYIFKKLDDAIFSNTISENKLKKFVSRRTTSKTDNELMIRDYISIEKIKISKNNIQMLILDQIFEIDVRQNDILEREILINEQNISDHDVEVQISFS